MSKREQALPKQIAIMPRNHVHFSRVPHVVHHIPEIERMCYGQDDVNRFSVEMMQDILALRVSLSNTHAPNQAEEVKLKSVGIESYLIPGSARRASARKRAHLEAVLAEQEQQGGTATGEETKLEKLSEVSKQGSVLARKLSYQLAVTRAQRI